MSNKIKCYDEEGRPNCYYYSITRYGRLCSFDGTWNPCKKDCPNFVPLEEEFSFDSYLRSEGHSCHKCIWRSYRDSSTNMSCDNEKARQKMRDDPTFHTPCEFFELDETGEECYLRQEEGYEWIKRERNLRK